MSQDRRVPAPKAQGRRQRQRLWNLIKSILICVQHARAPARGAGGLSRLRQSTVAAPSRGPADSGKDQTKWRKARKTPYETCAKHVGNMQGTVPR